MGHIRIVLQGVEIHDAKDGEVTLDIPIRNLEEKEHEVLGRLFPHTQLQIDQLLGTEALLSKIKRLG